MNMLTVNSWLLTVFDSESAMYEIIYRSPVYELAPLTDNSQQKRESQRPERDEKRSSGENKEGQTSEQRAGPTTTTTTTATTTVKRREGNIRRE